MKKERKEFERATVDNVTNPFSCNNCDFVGKNKEGYQNMRNLNMGEIVQIETHQQVRLVKSKVKVMNLPPK